MEKEEMLKYLHKEAMSLKSKLYILILKEDTKLGEVRCNQIKCKNCPLRGSKAVECPRNEEDDLGKAKTYLKSGNKGLASGKLIDYVSSMEFTLSLNLYNTAKKEELRKELSKVKDILDKPIKDFPKLYKQVKAYEKAFYTILDLDISE